MAQTLIVKLHTKRLKTVTLNSILQPCLNRKFRPWNSKPKTLSSKPYNLRLTPEPQPLNVINVKPITLSSKPCNLRLTPEPQPLNVINVKWLKH